MWSEDGRRTMPQRTCRQTSAQTLQMSVVQLAHCNNTAVAPLIPKNLERVVWRVHSGSSYLSSMAINCFAWFLQFCFLNSYSLFWDEMKIIDENCLVLEPLKPSKIDCHRRIKLNTNVSIQIKVDPRNPRELPEIIFLGSEACN